MVKRGVRKGPSALVSAHANSLARLVSQNNRDIERSEASLRPHNATSSQPDMPDFGDRRNYRAMASKSSTESATSMSQLGMADSVIHVKNDVDIQNHRASAG